MNTPTCHRCGQPLTEEYPGGELASSGLWSHADLLVCVAALGKRVQELEGRDQNPVRKRA